MSGIYEGKAVLIPGGSGMVGHALCQMLLEQGAKVTVASLDDPARAPPNVNFVKADLSNFNLCCSLCEGKDYVFNLTGVKGSPLTCREHPAIYFERSVILAMNMLRAARKTGVKRYLFTSSYSVYAPAEIFFEDDVFKTPPSENDFGNAWGKRIGELHVEAYRREFKEGNVCIVRPASVFGPYDLFSKDGMVVSALINRAFDEKPPLVVWGEGSVVRDFIYCKDVARGMLIMLEKMPDKAVNLGSGHGYSIQELAETIVKYVNPEIEIIFDTSKPTGDKRRVLDVERAKSYGFEAAYSLDEAIRETVEWYRNNRSNPLEGRYNIFDEKL
jgi:GDP-L-fucose synthase